MSLYRTGFGSTWRLQTNPTDRYVELVRSRSDRLERLEAVLSQLRLEGDFDAQLVSRLATGGQLTVGWTKLALKALAELGALEQSAPGRFRYDLARFEASSSLRDGIRIGARAARSYQEPPPPRLVCSLPPTLDRSLQDALAEDAVDLRVALIDLIASASETLVLASPFWDLDSTKELAEVIGKRLEAGVAVEALGRTADRSTHNGQAFPRAKRLVMRERVSQPSLTRHTIGTQSKRESPSLDSPVLVNPYQGTTSTVGTAGFEPATP